MRKGRLSLVGKALLCCTFVFNFWNAEAWSDKEQLKYAKLRKDDQNKEIYSQLTKPETRLTTQSGESLYNSFNNCSTIFQKAWELKRKTALSALKTLVGENNFTKEKLGEILSYGARRNGLALFIIAYAYFHNRPEIVQNAENVRKALDDFAGDINIDGNISLVELGFAYEYNYKDKKDSVLVSDIIWYLNNEKWKGADWLQKIWEDNSVLDRKEIKPASTPEPFKKEEEHKSLQKHGKTKGKIEKAPKESARTSESTEEEKTKKNPCRPQPIKVPRQRPPKQDRKNSIIKYEEAQRLKKTGVIFDLNEAIIRANKGLLGKEIHIWDSKVEEWHTNLPFYLENQSGEPKLSDIIKSARKNRNNTELLFPTIEKIIHHEPVDFETYLKAFNQKSDITDEYVNVSVDKDDAPIIKDYGIAWLNQFKNGTTFKIKSPFKSIRADFLNRIINVVKTINTEYEVLLDKEVILKRRGGDDSELPKEQFAGIIEKIIKYDADNDELVIDFTTQDVEGLKLKKFYFSGHLTNYIGQKCFDFFKEKIKIGEDDNGEKTIKTPTKIILPNNLPLIFNSQIPVIFFDDLKVEIKDEKKELDISVERSGFKTFWGSLLTHFSFGASNTLSKIPDGMFLGSTKLSKIVFPANLKEIGANAFVNCYRLYTTKDGSKYILKIPDSVTTIGTSAFAKVGTDISTEAAYELIIPTNLKLIMPKAFNAASNVVFAQDDGKYTNDLVICKEAFSECNLKNFTLPKNTKRICDYAGLEFDENYSFEEVIIPANVEYIGTSSLSSPSTKRIKFEGSKNSKLIIAPTASSNVFFEFPPNFISNSKIFMKNEDKYSLKGIDMQKGEAPTYINIAMSSPLPFPEEAKEKIIFPYGTSIEDIINAVWHKTIYFTDDRRHVTLNDIKELETIKDSIENTKKLAREKEKQKKLGDMWGAINRFIQLPTKYGRARQDVMELAKLVTIRDEKGTLLPEKEIKERLEGALPKDSK